MPDGKPLRVHVAPAVGQMTVLEVTPLRQGCAAIHFHEVSETNDADVAALVAERVEEQGWFANEVV
jgi:hypothetical protein